MLSGDLGGDPPAWETDVSTSSSLRPAAGVAAATLLATLAGAGAPAAQQGRPPQQAAPPFHRAAPMFRPAPPDWAGGGRRIPFTPNDANAQTADPSHTNPRLPLNNPSTLRPNFPLNHEATQEQAGPVTGLPAAGAAAPAGIAPAAGTGLPGPGAAQSSAALPLAGAAPVRQPVVLRPLPGAGGSLQTRPAFPVVQRSDRFWPLVGDRKFMWIHGARHAVVPATLLGVVLIGDSYWYPNGYVSMEGPACSGTTADGCQLQWRMVGFEDDEEEQQPQCVQYCPQAGPPPQQAATLPPPPATAEGGECQTTIYSEANFAGNSAPTGNSQPILSTTGWRNEIASIVVAAGTWDFFADENFGGESLRLTPGTYPRLPPEWTRHVGSFMCAKPDPPPA
jgi:hypothetical protein